MRFYELAAEYEHLLSLCEESPDVEALDVALADVEERIEAKGAGIAIVLASLDADAAALGAEEKRLAARRKTLERNAEHLREYVRHHMEARGISRIKAGTFAITLSAGPERVVIEDASRVPEEFLRRAAPEPSKSAILAAYKRDGECVAGTRIERGTRLSIR